MYARRGPEHTTAATHIASSRPPSRHVFSPEPQQAALQHTAHASSHTHTHMCARTCTCPPTPVHYIHTHKRTSRNAAAVSAVAPSARCTHSQGRAAPRLMAMPTSASPTTLSMPWHPAQGWERSVRSTASVTAVCHSALLGQCSAAQRGERGTARGSCPCRQSAGFSTETLLSVRQKLHSPCPTGPSLPRSASARLRLLNSRPSGGGRAKPPPQPAPPPPLPARGAWPTCRATAARTCAEMPAGDSAGILARCA